MTVTYDDSMKKILLINTSRFFLEEGKSVLDRKDFQVFMVSSTQEALMLHRKERVNLIVSELDMPEMGSLFHYPGRTRDQDGLRNPYLPEHTC
jgi:CheY-like chemotaxis protein